MDSIVLEDMIQHYCVRTNQALEEIEKCGNILISAGMLITDGWSGLAAENFANKLKECSVHQKSALEEAEAVRYMLNQILVTIDEC